MRVSTIVPNGESEGFSAIETFHLEPFTVNDLNTLSLAKRIHTCPQLNDINYLYPDVSKKSMLQTFDEQDRARSPPALTAMNGYVGSEVIMVAKTGFV
jgi:hypothetical protein